VIKSYFVGVAFMSDVTSKILSSVPAIVLLERALRCRGILTRNIMARILKFEEVVVCKLAVHYGATLYPTNGTMLIESP
jgi:hypothetical protein